jgi:hypothetical protein
MVGDALINHFYSDHCPLKGKNVDKEFYSSMNKDNSGMVLKDHSKE